MIPMNQPLQGRSREGAVRELICIAKGRGDSWEAICLDFDIAVSGDSFPAVKDSLNEAIVTYIQDALAERPEIRDRLLNRATPFFARLTWTWPFFFAALFRRADSKEPAQATVEFAVPCPA